MTGVDEDVGVPASGAGEAGNVEDAVQVMEPDLDPAGVAALSAGGCDIDDEVFFQGLLDIGVEHDCRFSYAGVTVQPIRFEVGAYPPSRCTLYQRGFSDSGFEKLRLTQVIAYPLQDSVSFRGVGYRSSEGREVGFCSPFEMEGQSRVVEDIGIPSPGPGQEQAGDVE